MTKLVPVLVLLLIPACSSDDSSGSSSSSSSSSSSGSSSGASSTSSSSGSQSGSCKNLAGTWKIGAHCDPSLIGKDVVVTQSACNLTFAAPFDGFTATVSADDKLTVSGPQTCTGTASASTLSMSCTPGTCTVTLSR